MDIIKVKDKEFSIFIKSEEILDSVARVANRINHDYKGKNPLFLVVLNGAFMFASDLMKKIDLECEVSFVKLSSYSGTASTEKVKHLIGINEDFTTWTFHLRKDAIFALLTLSIASIATSHLS